MKTLFKNANLIDENGDVKTNLDLLVADGKIAEIGENLSCDDAEIIDCTDRFITPGFVSMHCHTPMNIFKGIAEDDNIDDAVCSFLEGYQSVTGLTDEQKQSFLLMRRLVRLQEYATILYVLSEPVDEKPNWMNELIKKLKYKVQCLEKSMVIGAPE